MDLRAVSPNGRYFSGVDWSTGDLAVLELATGRIRRLTSEGFGAEGGGVSFAEFSRISPDGKSVAYAWYTENFDYELRVVGFDGSAPRVVYRGEERVDDLEPHSWSPDGKQILAVVTTDRGDEVVLVSVEDGSLRVMKALGQRSPKTMTFSPDGQYLAYTLALSDDDPQRDIFLLSTDGSREVPLVSHPADDLLLGWSPDGSYVLFASDRGGGLAAWTVSVVDGAPRGGPERVAHLPERFDLIGFSRDGSYFFKTIERSTNVYVATLDAATGTVLSPPVAVSQRYVGVSDWPEWSPDGRSLAFVSRPGGSRLQVAGAVGQPGTLSILSFEAEKERQLELSPLLDGLMRLRWSPDGRSVLATGRDRDRGGGLFEIDVDTGKVTAIWLSGSWSFPRQTAWAPDGQTIYYSKADDGDGAIPWAIYRRDLRTRTEKKVVSGVFDFALSPDGQMLLVVSLTSWNIVSIADGASRELLELTDPAVHRSSPTWSRDGLYLLFIKQYFDRSKQLSELWRIPVHGGEPQRLGVSMRGLMEVRAHPDGQRIAFFGGEGRSEIWVMQSFLTDLAEGS